MNQKVKIYRALSNALYDARSGPQAIYINENDYLTSCVIESIITTEEKTENTTINKPCPTKTINFINEYLTFIHKEVNFHYYITAVDYAIRVMIKLTPGFHQSALGNYRMVDVDGDPCKVVFRKRKYRSTRKQNKS